MGSNEGWPNVVLLPDISRWLSYWGCPERLKKLIGLATQRSFAPPSPLRWTGGSLQVAGLVKVQRHHEPTFLPRHGSGRRVHLAVCRVPGSGWGAATCFAQSASIFELPLGIIAFSESPLVS